MKGHGWVDGDTWGREVSVSADVRRRISGEVEQRNGTCRATRDMTMALPVATWQALGVRTAAGGSLAPGAPDASPPTIEASSPRARRADRRTGSLTIA